MTAPRKPAVTTLPCLLGAAVLALAACDSAAPPTDAPAPAAATPSAPAAPTASAPTASGSLAGNFAITNPDIAKTLPAFVVLPGNARIVMHMPMSNGVRRSGTIMGDSPSSQGDLLAWLRKTMPSGDLAMKPETTGPKGEVNLTVESPDGRTSYSINVFPTRDGRTVFQANYVEPMG
ncbi:MAG: hypothetical protein GC145_17030 [Caulobacter sp.]|nr:hypothetical protein [Caulobacter sp.]